MTSVPSPFRTPERRRLARSCPSGDACPSPSRRAGSRASACRSGRRSSPSLVAFVVVSLVQVLVVAVIELAGGDVDAFAESDARDDRLTVVLDVSLVVCSDRDRLVAQAGRPDAGRSSACASPSGLRRSAGRWLLRELLGRSRSSPASSFGKPEDQDIVTDLKAEDSVLVLVGFGVMTCVLAPLAEEFFFRGFLFSVAGGAD